MMKKISDMRTVCELHEDKEKLIILFIISKMVYQAVHLKIF